MSQEKNKKSSRVTFIIIILILCSPVFIATTLYLSGYKPNNMNYGDLLSVQKLSGEGVNQTDDSVFNVDDLHGKWVMLIIDSGECAKACQDKLFYMRQVRTMQHHEKIRIERLFLINDDKTISEDLLEEYQGTLFINAKNSSLIEAIGTTDTHKKHIYLIDYMGNLMMRFPEELEPMKMSEDIKRLLQVSQLEY